MITAETLQSHLAPGVARGLKVFRSGILLLQFITPEHYNSDRRYEITASLDLGGGRRFRLFTVGDRKEKAALKKTAQTLNLLDLDSTYGFAKGLEKLQSVKVETEGKQTAWERL